MTFFSINPFDPTFFRNEMFDKLEGIPGIHTPTIFVASKFTTFGNHVEDFSLVSSNFVQAGAPKVWTRYKYLSVYNNFILKTKSIFSIVSNISAFHLNTSRRFTMLLSIPGRYWGSLDVTTRCHIRGSSSARNL